MLPNRFTGPNTILFWDISVVGRACGRYAPPAKIDEVAPIRPTSGVLRAIGRLSPQGGADPDPGSRAPRQTTILRREI